MVMRFTEDDRARVADAIASAERGTSGEIFCVVSRRVSSYKDVSLAWAAAAALLAPTALIPLGFTLSWPVGDGWEAAHVTAQAVGVGQALAFYALVQAVIFVAVFLLTRIPPVLRWITPRSLRQARVRKAALQQFLAHGVHVTRERTGVLIFAALKEHQVELIADELIHEKVDEGVWADAVAALTRQLKAGRPVAGFEAAIDQCGRVLAAHFPPRADNPNELPDHLVLL
ncbi:MAG: TPM domain-containing protein [Alphaproteobacteria bacterium]|nr:TPM domain-containing protein [Alphaproteobacteria bacterium]MBU1520135.1 TPM domain-containing protein [Alphaproteobacteria bacterium]MBU2030312.1 TPM domain-containing protein [Alphaproteobacteria bacterium]MBU2231122.1 TPM domain-containing protein [Alphaproteobacteria bacterium]MBU2349301.1 TPM domain-containing protein [Alphaproteobacteria bacterium]